MKVYHITRTRLITERFRVSADTENSAYDLLDHEDEEADNVVQVEEETIHSSVHLDRIEIL